MRTNVSIIENSEGGLMSEIADKIKDLGFTLTIGMHDFQYEWEGLNVTPERIINLIDKVQKKLKGLNVGLYFMTD
jgi:hypothetical protein